MELSEDSAIAPAVSQKEKKGAATSGQIESVGQQKNTISLANKEREQGNHRPTRELRGFRQGGKILLIWGDTRLVHKRKFIRA